jgi:hypothetical protein
MSNVLHLSDSLSGKDVRDGKTSLAGIYGLVDTRHPDTIRYVGSSENIAARLYSHWHSRPAGSAGRTPKSQWLDSLHADGAQIAAVVLEACDPGPRQSKVRMAREGHHIQRLHEVGQADLNVQLVPVGHANSIDSYGKVLRAELIRLRAENADLRQRLAAAEMA